MVAKSRLYRRAQRPPLCKGPTRERCQRRKKDRSAGIRADVGIGPYEDTVAGTFTKSEWKSPPCGRAMRAPTMKTGALAGM